MISSFTGPEIVFDISDLNPRACAKAGVAANQTLWHQGYQQGIPRYCTPLNGLRVGSQGKSYANVCPANLEPAFREGFNLAKGSIPVRLGMSRDKFDTCADSSMDAFNAASASGDLLPSMAHGMSVNSMVQGAMFDVITNFFNTEDMTPEQAADKLARAVKASM